jgi:uncharacterized protein GlcG (DUF336 family)
VLVSKDNYSVSLAEARTLLDRAVNKCEALTQAGTFIVVDSSGSPVSAARMDGCSPAALPLVRAKAFAAAANGEPSARFAARMAKFGSGVFASYQALLRDQPFPGAGGMPFRKDGRIIGAIATGLGISPLVKLPGVDPSAFVADGKPANLEDILISYALGVPYNAQHGDDVARWLEAYGAPLDPAIEGTAIAVPPASSRQPTLMRARSISDHAMTLAAAAGVLAAVVIVDAGGDTVTLDRMDGAPPMGVDVAAAVAVAAVNFGVPSGEIAEQHEYAVSLTRLMEIVPYRMLALPGGCPMRVVARLVGAVGVYCNDLDAAQAIAQGAAEFGIPFFKESIHE